MLLSKMPSESECIQLLKKCKVPGNVIAHALKVQEVASMIASKCGADADLVTAGAILHDIGRCETHGIMHACVGAKLLEKYELPDEIIEIVRKHIGAGFTAEEAAAFGFPPGNYIPQTLEEKIVCHADNLVAGIKLLSCSEKFNLEMQKGHPSTAYRIQAMHNELSSLCGIDLDILLSNK